MPCHHLRYNTTAAAAATATIVTTVATVTTAVAGLNLTYMYARRRSCGDDGEALRGAIGCGGRQREETDGHHLGGARGG